MSVFVRSRRNDNVLVGFGALLMIAVAVRLGAGGSTAAAAVFGLLGAGVVAVGVWLNRQPGRELRISPTEIAYVVKGRVTERIGHAEAGGRVRVHKEIQRGHAWFSLVDADMATGTSLPLEGFRFREGELAAACAAHGWQLIS